MLPPPEQRRLEPFLSRVPLKQRQQLHAAGERMRTVYFLLDGVCSIVTPMSDGRMVEVAMVGREGMVGLSAAFGIRHPTTNAIAQSPGLADAMTMEAFAGEIRRRGPLHDVVSRYAGVFLSSVMQSAACNGLHAADARCARWLLHTHDRIGKETFAFTQELLAVMLGVRRATITVVASEFQRAGLVEFGRRRVTILNRSGLETIACECYRVITGQFERMT